MKTTLAVLLLSLALPAQQTPYPRSGGTSPQIPVPSRKSKQKAGKEPEVPLPSFQGTLKAMDAKSIVLRLGDERELDFKRTDKTKFFRNGKESASPDSFKAGDQISVEAQEDMRGFFTAANVYWEKEASAVTDASRDANSVDAWAIEPPRQPAAQVKPAPARPDPDDPGPPQLRRGRPADPSREVAKQPPAQVEPPQSAAAQPPRAQTPIETARANPPSAPSRPRPDDDLPFGSRQEDPLIRKAADAALDFTETLPNYVCREVITRYQSNTSPARWQPLDVVTADLVYEDQKENYRNLTVGGKKVEKKIEEIEGAWSTGEFAAVLINLFSPATNAVFRYSKDSRAAGINAKEYTFEVARDNSNWTVIIASQKYRPAYSGAVWIDPATGRVLRIEMSAKGFPSEFPSDHVESATDYEYIRFGGTKQYLLPVHAEMLSCQRGSNNCYKNTIDFRNYHKFEGESSITFGDEKP